MTTIRPNYYEDLNSCIEQRISVSTLSRIHSADNLQTAAAPTATLALALSAMLGTTSQTQT